MCISTSTKKRVYLTFEKTSVASTNQNIDSKDFTCMFLGVVNEPLF